jgi:hypothetical protein
MEILGQQKKDEVLSTYAHALRVLDRLHALTNQDGEFIYTKDVQRAINTARLVLRAKTHKGQGR